jgi:hypothetical protein
VARPTLFQHQSGLFDCTCRPISSSPSDRQKNVSPQLNHQFSPYPYHTEYSVIFSRTPNGSPYRSNRGIIENGVSFAVRAEVIFIRPTDSRRLEFSAVQEFRSEIRSGIFGIVVEERE